mmetsp:Transcript_156141/g.500866  ORF Transcript_156141/g.500866 Transcript_156141/m.500866 type:complete len:129 (-) Transcript_156141:51-437(-)
MVAGQLHRHSRSCQARRLTDICGGRQTMLRTLSGSGVKEASNLHALRVLGRWAYTEHVREAPTSIMCSTIIGTSLIDEMRMFATPFYEERLEEKRTAVEKQEPDLQAAYREAQQELAAFQKEKGLAWA